MDLTGWIGLTLGVVMVTAAKVGPPPVILDLGPVAATPAPTPKHEQKKRLITTITVQNSAAGASVVTFEATDIADEGKDKIRTIAAKSYSLADERPELRELRERIMVDLRKVEREMLQFVERAGPPKAREPLQAGSERPY